MTFKQMLQISRWIGRLGVLQFWLDHDHARMSIANTILEMQTMLDEEDKKWEDS